MILPTAKARSSSNELERRFYTCVCATSVSQSTSSHLFGVDGRNFLVVCPYFSRDLLVESVFAARRVVIPHSVFSSSLTRVTKSYLSTLGTTQINSVFTSFAVRITPLTCFSLFSPADPPVLIAGGDLGDRIAFFGPCLCDYAFSCMVK